METGVWCSPGLVSSPPFVLRHLTYATSCRTSGLQISAMATARRVAVKTYTSDRIGRCAVRPYESARPALTTSVAQYTVNECATSWQDSTIIAPVCVCHHGSCAKRYSKCILP